MRSSVGPSLDFSGRSVVSSIMCAVVNMRPSEQAGLLDLSSDAIFARDMENRITFWSKGAVEAYGYSREEALGQVPYELLQTVSPEPLECIEEKVLREGRWAGELIHTRKDGSKVIDSSRWAVERDGEGNPVSILETNTDITERKRAQDQLSKELERMSRLHAISARVAHSDDVEALLQEILAAAADFTGTDKGNIQFLNPETGNLRIVVHQGFGQRFLDYFAEHGWGATCDAALAKGERIIVEDVAKAPGVQGTEGLEVVLGDGIRAIQSTPLVSRSGVFVGMLSNHFRYVHRPSEMDLRYLDLLARMAADLIERKQAVEALREREQALRKAHAALGDRALHLESLVAERTEKLQEAVKELQHMSYAMIHDMRAPLRAMGAFADILSNEAADAPVETRRDYLERIMTGAKRLDELVSDALQYNKAVLREVRLQAVELGPLLLGLVSTYPNLSSKFADIVIEDGLPAVVGNEGLLTQCFGNLLGNAVKFVAPGTRPRVRVRGEVVDGLTRIWVEDNGIGIPEHARKRLFGLFERLSPDYEGTGLGLAIVRKVGSRFWVELRVAEANVRHQPGEVPVPA